MPEPPPIPWAIEPLSPRHDRTSFDCGKDSLNDFLIKYAGQNQRLSLGRTYVAVHPGSATVRGFYTLSGGSMQFTSMPERARRGLPRYPLPVAHLGRLAVDRQAQGEGLGRLLLLDAMERVVRLAETIGIHAIEVRAKDTEAKTFYLHYGFVELLDDPLHLFVPLATLQKLGLVQ